MPLIQRKMEEERSEKNLIRLHLNDVANKNQFGLKKQHQKQAFYLS